MPSYIWLCLKVFLVTFQKCRHHRIVNTNPCEAVQLETSIMDQNLKDTNECLSCDNLQKNKALCSSISNPLRFPLTVMPGRELSGWCVYSRLEQSVNSSWSVLSSFMFHVLYACRHLMEIKEGKGNDERISSDQEESLRGSTCAFMIFLCFWPWLLIITAEDLYGFAHLHAICSSQHR